MRELLYVDSNIFIYPAIYEPKEVAKASYARNILMQIVTGKIEACTSILTWDEVVWVVWRYFGVESALNQGRRLLELPNIRFLPVDFETVSVAQELTVAYKVKPRDSIHAGTAIKNRVKDIVSDDEDFDSIPKLRRIPVTESFSLG